MNTVKTFLCPSEGMQMRFCSDRLAVSPAKGRFCIADGVSGSHLGGAWAWLLCQDFISEASPATEWAKEMDDERKDVLSDLWNEECDEMERNSAPDSLRRLKRTRSYFGHGASTITGISISGGRLYYSIIGDSCLWLKSRTGELRCLPEGINITNIADAVTSDWKVFPGPDKGELPLEEGLIVLATDALSEWIAKMNDNGKDGIAILAGLESDDDFVGMIQKYRNAPEPERLKDDDVGVIIIDIQDADNETFTK